MSICLRRRIGVLVPFDENDPVPKPGLSAFTQALADLGWTDGRNVRIDLRWAGGEFNRMRALAQELIGLEPDIILTGAEAVTAAANDPDRLCGRDRPCRPGHRRAAEPAWWERHRLRRLRSLAGRQVA